MIIFPAIDLKDGKCVRLRQGIAQQKTVYSDNPAEMARRWESEGAQFLHVVDLDGAFTGTAGNLDAVEQIVKAVSIPVQLGGGIRNMEQLEKRFEIGAARCILGTGAISSPEFAKTAAKRYPGRVVAGIDAKDGKVAVDGWVNQTNVEPIALAKQLFEVGFETAVFTDISKDGMLTGPNIETTLQLQIQSGMRIIASGGVSSVRDIEQLSKAGIYGAITGKALYDGRLMLADALRAAL